MPAVNCRTVRPRLLEQGGLVDEITTAHVAECSACNVFARQIRADVALLRSVLPAEAPADLVAPIRGSRPVPSLALAEGRSLPAVWLAVPAAAAVVLLAVGIWSVPLEPAAPRVADVRIEVMDGPEWAGVMRIASDAHASGPAGPLVDQLIDGIAEGGEGR
jgi:hypothetical protein